MGEAFRTLRVPASSANLGPGFDALGMALGIYLECRFRPAQNLSIQAHGCDAALISTAEDNLIWKTARRVGAPRSVELIIQNAIPVGKGLGSSAAAAVAGLVIGSELAGLAWDRWRVLEEAVRMEGHPDNAAACVLGGIVASAMDSNGCARAARFELHPRFGVAVVVPDFLLPTVESRGVLPESYLRADTIFNVQRAALLVAALSTGASEAFPAALEDRLHQRFRFGLVPGLEEVTALRARGLLGCALSGAGPSILVFYERGHEEVCELVRKVFASCGRGSETLHVNIAEHGYLLNHAQANQAKDRS
jgi:homoserine kinase